MGPHALRSALTEYRLLEEFRKIFEGKRYIHRASTLGDFVAMHFYEDLVALNRSPKLIAAVTSQEQVINIHNKWTDVVFSRAAQRLPVSRRHLPC